MRPFCFQNGEDHVEDPQEYERQYPDDKDSEEALLESHQAVGDDGQQVGHISGKSEGKGLSPDDDIPPHHEDAEDDQNQSQYSPFDGEIPDCQKTEGDNVSQEILENENGDKILPVDNIS